MSQDKKKQGIFNKMMPFTVFGKRKLDSVLESLSFSHCLFCQKETSEKMRSSNEGVVKIKEAASQRQMYNDHKNREVFERLSQANTMGMEKSIVYHKSCYITFTHTSHIQRVKTKFRNSQSNTSRQLND